jgi:hypothetical protein
VTGYAYSRRDVCCWVGVLGMVSAMITSLAFDDNFERTFKIEQSKLVKKEILAVRRCGYSDVVRGTVYVYGNYCKKLSGRLGTAYGWYKWWEWGLRLLRIVFSQDF